VQEAVGEYVPGGDEMRSVRGSTVARHGNSGTTFVCDGGKGGSGRYLKDGVIGWWLTSNPTLYSI
jgi:hypothetical protein